MCGDNVYGELFTTEPGYPISTPSETTIRGGASFVIAGGGASVVFVGTEPPANTPNRRINEKVKHETSGKVTDLISPKLEKCEK